MFFQQLTLKDLKTERFPIKNITDYKFEVIEIVPKTENILEREKYYIQKFYKEICLAEQAFIKDGDLSVAKYVANNGGEILKMVRYEVGEGMEKRNDNFAEEVMKQLK